MLKGYIKARVVATALWAVHKLRPPQTRPQAGGYRNDREQLTAISIRLELRLLRRNFFVGAFGAHVVAESANPGLGDDQLAAGESQRDLTFLFRPFGFEDG